MTISYEKMIKEIKRDISFFENQVEFCMDQMRKRSYANDKDALDEQFKRAMHFMISLWNTETCLIQAQIAHEAKIKSGAVYGKAALEGEKDEMYNNDGCNDSGHGS